MEYKLLTDQEYQRYHKNATTILQKVAKYHRLPLEEVTYKQIIDYFEKHYNILFVFLDYDPHATLYGGLIAKEPKVEDIKFRGLTRRRTIMYETIEVCKKMSGMTMTDDTTGQARYVVYVNQYKRSLGNVLFTILHELSHIFCHYENDHSREVYASLYSNDLSHSTSNYPVEIAPFEDEANTVASILLLNDNIMEKILENQIPFNDVLQKYGSSGIALFNRVKNYLIYNRGCSHNLALQFALDYRNAQ